MRFVVWISRLLTAVDAPPHGSITALRQEELEKSMKWLDFTVQTEGKDAGEHRKE